MNRPIAGLQNQTLLQVALHTCEQEDFLLQVVKHARKSGLRSFELYDLRPNEEMPL